MESLHRRCVALFPPVVSSQLTRRDAGALVLISFIGNGLMDLRTASKEMVDAETPREQEIYEERIASRRTSYDEPRESERQGLLPVMENRIEENNSRGEAG